MTNIENKQVLEWLTSQDATPLRVKDGHSGTCIFFKLNVTENVDVIYGKYLWSDEISDLEFTARPKYLGLFSHRDQKLYDTQPEYHFTIENKLYDPKPCRREWIMDSIKEQVTQYIWKRFESNAEFANPASSEEHGYYCEHTLEKDASELFLRDHKPQLKIDFNWNETFIFEFVNDPDALIRYIAEKLITVDGERLNREFLYVKAEEKKIEEIKKDPFHPAQAARRIRETIEVYSAHRAVNTVKIGLLDKENNEVYFKIDANTLISGLVEGLNILFLATEQDKILFNDRMDASKEVFYAKDIVSIHFGRTCLYFVEQDHNRVHYMSWDAPGSKIVVNLDDEGMKGEER